MPDKEIIELFFSRDENALAKTKAQYGRLIFSVAMGILHNEQDSEDCECETYLRAWNSIPPNKPQHLAAYLCKIARRLALDRYDYNHASKRGSAVPLEELEGCLKSVAGAEDRLSEKELAHLLNSFLHGQDYNTRVIFMRRYWFGESSGEIAKRLHVSESMVKSRVSRTLKKLRDFLRKQGYDTL